MASDDLDILISRYAEGDALSPAERARVERALDTDAAANDLLAGEHRLTDLLRAAPLPAVNYELLATRISAAIPQAPSRGDVPVTAHRAFWSTSKLALAASVLIAVGVAVPLLTRDGPATSPPTIQSTPTGASPMAAVPVTIRAVDGNPAVADNAAGSQTVTVGPSASFADRPAGDRYAETGANRPAKVVISGETATPMGSDHPLAPR
jgi:anti-sigma factor RsiW